MIINERKPRVSAPADDTGRRKRSPSTQCVLWVPVVPSTVRPDISEEGPLLGANWHRSNEISLLRRSHKSSEILSYIHCPCIGTIQSIEKGVLMSRVKIGKHWFPAGGGQNSVVQLVAPTDNKQGVILRTISLGNGGAGQAQVVIYADTHAPAAPGDGNTRQIAVYNSPNGFFTSLIVPYEIEVPAGLGIWLGFTGAAQAQLTYDFIDV